MGGKGSGRRPVPREVKELRGTARADRVNGRRPEPKDDPPKCPWGTPKPIRKQFKRLVEGLEPTGMLRAVDVDLLYQLASAIHIHREAAEALAEDGAVYEDTSHGGRPAKSPWFQIWRDSGKVIRQLSGHFGLSPSDREKLTVPVDEEPDELDLLLGWKS